MMLEHRPVAGESDDHPYKAQCSCGRWFYRFENHLKDVVTAHD